MDLTKTQANMVLTKHQRDCSECGGEKWEVIDSYPAGIVDDVDRSVAAPEHTYERELISKLRCLRCHTVIKVETWWPLLREQ